MDSQEAYIGGAIALNVTFGGDSQAPTRWTGDDGFAWPEDGHFGGAEGTYSPDEAAARAAAAEMRLGEPTVDVSVMTGRGLGIAVAARMLARQ